MSESLSELLSTLWAESWLSTSKCVYLDKTERNRLEGELFTGVNLLFVDAGGPAEEIMREERPIVSRRCTK